MRLRVDFQNAFSLTAGDPDPSKLSPVTSVVGVTILRERKSKLEMDS